MAERERALEEELRKKFPVEIDETALAAVKLPAGVDEGRARRRSRRTTRKRRRPVTALGMTHGGGGRSARRLAIATAGSARRRRARSGGGGGAGRTSCAPRCARSTSSRAALDAHRPRSSRARAAPSAKGCRCASRRTTSRSATGEDPRCPIRLQCVPRADEAREVPGDLADPLGEVAHEVAPHLVQRYPDRALLLATDRCGVYCRFCTRSRMVGDGGGAVALERLAPGVRLPRARTPRCAT